jgi:hypothetical protein
MSNLFPCGAESILVVLERSNRSLSIAGWSRAHFRDASERVEPPQPADQWVRTGENLVHQLLTFTAAQFSRHFEDRFCTPPMWSQQGRVCKRVQNLCIIGCLFSLSELFSNLRPL